MDELLEVCILSQEEQPLDERLPPDSSGHRDSDSNDGKESGIDTQHRRKRAQASQQNSEPAPLTRKNLARLDNMNRHDSKDKERGKGKGSGSTPTSQDSTGSASSRKTLSTTAPGFAIKAFKNGVLDLKASKPPNNLQDIRNCVDRSRASASLPESAYNAYTYSVRGADNEATMFAETLPLLKKYPEEPYKRIINKAFTAFPRDVGFNNGLSAPQPDYAEGLEMAEFLPVPIDEHISGAVLYGDTPRAVTLPHLAGEWKGRRGDMDEATLQSAYDGAALVYARNQAMAYQGRSDDAGHAHITTFTTDGTHVNLYAHYAVSTEDGTMQYHQYPIGSTSLVNSFGEFEQGRKQLRNLQDRAREQSYALKEELRVYYTQQRLNGGGGSLQPVAENDIPSSCAAVSALATEPQFASGDQNNRDHDQDHGHNEGISADQPMLSSSFKQDSGKTRSPSSSHHKPSLSHSSKTGSSTHGSVHNRGQKRKASFSHKSAGMRRNGPTNEKTQDD